MSNVFYMSLRTQYENLGDYLIAQATIDILSEHGDIVLDTRKVPQSYIQLFSFPDNSRLTDKGFLPNILEHRNKQWHYIVKPGGYSASVSIKQKNLTLLMALYFWCSQKIFRTKIFKFPHSFKGQATLPDSIYHKLLDCNLCRDKETLEQYDRLKLPNLYLQPDLALYYYGKPSKFRFETQSSRQNIAIALRYDRLANEPEIAHCVAKLLLDKDVQTIKYVSQVTLDYDINASEAKRNNVPIVNYNITNASLKAITETYAISKYVISNRLHALLLGMINGAIPIAIIDAKEDRKILSYLEILGVPWVEKENLCESDALANMLKNFSFPQYKSEHIQKCIRQLLVNHA